MREKEMKNTAAKLRIFIMVAVVLAVVCLACLLIPKIIVGYRFRPIDADQVESIVYVWHGGDYRLDAAKQAEFMGLYNQSEYHARELEWATTPGGSYRITLRDGSKIGVIQYGHLWIVDLDYDQPGNSYYDNSYYIENQDLRDFHNRLFPE